MADIPAHTGIARNYDDATPVIVGIGGGTASGKSTLASRVVNALDSAVVLHMDDYYWESLPSTADNYDDPRSIRWFELAHDVQRLVDGETVDVPIFDYETTTSDESRTVEPADVILIEGLWACIDWRTLNPLNDADLLVYVETPPDVRLARRVRRDVVERGESIDEVVDRYLDQVRPMHQEWVEPTAAAADLVVRGDGDAHEAVLGMLDRL